MIDPKLNQIPVDPAGDLGDAELSEQQRARGPRRGLSINDTIAGDANLSVGSRGVDTSGVVSGSGAGAGMTSVTPGTPGESPAPNIAPGARSSGTTPRGATGVDQMPTTRLQDPTESGPEETNFTYDEISARAHQCWYQRGCPQGSPEVDWDRAIEELRSERRHPRTSAASA